MIARNSIEQIRQQVRIEAVVSPVVALKQSGNQMRGLSPFSQEKTPSFYINPDKNVFFCFSSNQGGDVIRFLQLHENLNFSEAVETLAERFQIPLEYESGGGATESRSLARELFDIHEQACDYYHRCFREASEQAESVRTYWSVQRKFPLELADEFQIGFSPPDSHPLNRLLAKKGFSLEALKKCGLFYTRDNDTDPLRFRPRFRGRLMVPIRNNQGQVTAFTARKLDLTPGDDPSRDAKYINSPETPIFHKGKIVFGLERARLHLDKDRPSFVLVEGQLDALRCFQVGIKNAVAPQGTAVTEAQLILLKRFATRIDCVLDGDTAGQKAALRLLPLAMKTGHEVRFLEMPSGVDPDTLLADGGLEAWQQLKGRALSAMEFAVRSLMPEAAPTAREMSEILSNIFEILSECDSAIAREEYLGEAINLVGSDSRATRDDFRKFLHRKARRFGFQNRESGEAPETENVNRRLTTSEYELLLCLLHYDWLAEPIAKAIDIEWVDKSLLHGIVLCRLLADIKEGLWEGTDKIDTLLENEEEKNCIYAILTEKLDFEEPVKVANSCLRALFEKYVRERRNRIGLQIQNLPKDSSEFAHLQRKQIELRRLEKTLPAIQISQS